MKKKITALIIATMVATVICTSCGKKDVDYEVSTAGDATASDAPLQDEDSQGVLDIVLNIGDEQVILDEQYELPLSKPNIYKASLVIWDEESKKNTLNQLFGAEVYACGDEQIPKSMVQYSVTSYEKWQGTDGDEYDALLEKYANAPDNWIKTSDYSSDEYVMEENGVFYEIIFHYGCISINPYSDVQYIQQKGMDEKYISAGFTASIQPLDTEHIQASIQKIEACQTAALNYIARFDTGEFEMAYCSEVTLSADYYDNGINGMKRDDIPYGYLFTFYRKLDSLVVDGHDYSDKYFSTVEEEQEYIGKIFDEDNNVIEKVKNERFEAIYVMIDFNGGLLYLNYNSPLKDVKKTGTAVNIIEFDKVKGVIVNELVNNPRYDPTMIVYNDDGTMTYSNLINDYDSLTFEYVRIKGEKYGEYVIIPVWCLRKETRNYSVCVMVNAMDGSIVYPVDECRWE